VSVTCDVTSSFQVALNKGQGSFAARQLQSGANVLYYNLYTDALRSLIWGDGTVGTALLSAAATAVTYTYTDGIPGDRIFRPGVTRFDHGHAGLLTSGTACKRVEHCLSHPWGPHSSDCFHRQNNLAAYRSEQTHVLRTDGFGFRQVAADQNAGDWRVL